MQMNRTFITTSLICLFLAIFSSKHLKNSWKFCKNMWYCTEQITRNEFARCSLDKELFLKFGNDHGLWIPNEVLTQQKPKYFGPKSAVDRS